VNCCDLLVDRPTAPSLLLQAFVVEGFDSADQMHCVVFADVFYAQVVNDEV
jgi:hypothetical protein